MGFVDRVKNACTRIGNSIINNGQNALNWAVEHPWQALTVTAVATLAGVGVWYLAGNAAIAIGVGGIVLRVVPPLVGAVTAGLTQAAGVYLGMQVYELEQNNTELQRQNQQQTAVTAGFQARVIQLTHQQIIHEETIQKNEETIKSQQAAFQRERAARTAQPQIIQQPAQPAAVQQHQQTNPDPFQRSASRHRARQQPSPGLG